MMPVAAGDFTMPVESEYEALSFQLAETWGADAIRDSSGTSLSRSLLDSGYSVYATLCVIRGHNEWLRGHTNCLQQCFLSSKAVTAVSEVLDIELLRGFSTEQFRINDTAEALALWQVYDRTTEIKVGDWSYDPSSGYVTIKAIPFHDYSVNFMVWRIWEEIVMYNHVTNDWDEEHQAPLDPIYPEAQAYLKDWLEDWCRQNPEVNIVRFTSIFYNFTWIWGDHRQNIFSDWASYDFAVSPLALKLFEESYGYALCAEDFTRQGKYNATHRPPNRKKRDWMAFVADFSRGFAAQLIEIVHSYGKKALVFYDDSWIGLEPYNGKFAEFGFDGLIKCVFSGFEARLCAGVEVPVHELRLHPYLFPVGLNGTPTFSAGGDPAGVALQYWRHIRRALLREGVERLGLGGYPHLTQGFPDFVDAITDILAEFRTIKSLHTQGQPLKLDLRVGVLHTWGSLRSWTLSGHFHETADFPLIHINEALSGLPVEVVFLDFDEVCAGALSDIDVLINAGAAGDAWSGGAYWSAPGVCEQISAFVHGGGAFIGVGEPTAATGYDTFFRMSRVLGVDLDTGEYACHGKRAYAVSAPGFDVPSLPCKRGIILTDDDTQVLSERDGQPTLTVHTFGAGKGIYLSGFETGEATDRFLQDLLLYASDYAGDEGLLTDDPLTECAVYPDAGQIAFINNSTSARQAHCTYGGTDYTVQLEAGGFQCINI